MLTVQIGDSSAAFYAIPVAFVEDAVLGPILFLV